MKLLQGKTVLVTGGSTGIGRAAAVGAAQHGADVVINYLDGESWVKSLRVVRRGGRVITCGATDGYDPKTDFQTRAGGTTRRHQ